MISESEKQATVHPQHYGGDVRYEVIKIVEARKLDFNLGNAFKYLVRAGKKDPAKAREDLVKALFYVERAYTRGLIHPPLADSEVPEAYTTHRVLLGLIDSGLPESRKWLVQDIICGDTHSAYIKITELLQETPTT